MMPHATASRPCSTPRCPNLQPCSQHERKPFATAKRTGAALYKTARWKRERADFLTANPMCDCGAASTVADHRIPHRGAEALFWDQGNWQPLCRRCHNAKTGRETRERVRASEPCDYPYCETPCRRPCDHARLKRG